MDRDLYSIKEARQRLGGISRNSIYAMLRSDQLGSVVIGCRRFIAASAIADLITRSTTITSPAKETARLRRPSITCLALRRLQSFVTSRTLPENISHEVDKPGASLLSLDPPERDFTMRVGSIGSHSCDIRSVEPLLESAAG